ncbi:hypothetical protein CERSUDRAFT_99771 [Gelatoporia subvermispora B]|uniref:NACHT domain-containing protein n=1 Tax=Ceriporiopsis subvermispora (strain B) TaxID=914234 RepID=M2R1E6_CERS8|nr:hypothetical protein CERSUDRAFT_99771 [Gelatoporia subvermispora B]
MGKLLDGLRKLLTCTLGVDVPQGPGDSAGSPTVPMEVRESPNTKASGSPADNATADTVATSANTTIPADSSANQITISAQSAHDANQVAGTTDPADGTDIPGEAASSAPPSEDHVTKTVDSAVAADSPSRAAWGTHLAEDQITNLVLSDTMDQATDTPNSADDVDRADRAASGGPLLASSAGRNGWLMLKSALKSAAECCDMVLPVKAALSGIVGVMEMVDTVRDTEEDFHKIALRVEVVEELFRRYTSEYNSEDVLPPVIHQRFKRLSRELNLIKDSIEPKMKHSRMRRAIMVFGDAEFIKDMFEKLAEILETFHMDCNLNIERMTHDATARSLLAKLGHIPDAGIDSQTADECMPNTRVQVLEDVQGWVNAARGARIFWLNGMAGTGKSTIARSVCNILRAQNRLGGSFFCSRGTRDDVKRIIPTLAMSLADQNPVYRLALLEVLKKKPDAAYHRLDLQLQHLLEEPLLNAFSSKAAIPVLVIDALDECLDHDATKDMLLQLASPSRHIPVRLFVTSRPEQHIRALFNSAQPEWHSILRLHDIEEAIIESDIGLYITERLKRIRSSWEAEGYAFPPEWPSTQSITILTKQAGKLFVYASTVLKFISKTNPMERLEDLTRLGFVPEGSLTGPLDSMYSLIINNALDPRERTMAEISRTKELLAIILAIREPLSISVLSSLLKKQARAIRILLEPLHAVIYTPPQDDSGAVTTFHASFEDYLTTDGRAPENFRINVSDGHQALADACGKIMDSGALYFNIARCQTSYAPNSGQTLATISPILSYSCTHWPEHLVGATNVAALLPLFEAILTQKMLFWIETVTLVRGVRWVSHLLELTLTVNVELSQTFHELLHDARLLSIQCQEAIELSIPHLYLSALPTAPASSAIAQMFWPKFRNIPRVHRHVSDVQQQQEQPMSTSGHLGTAIRSVAFSPDATYIVSGSDNGTLRLWDARTGDEILKPLNGHTSGVTSVVFSLDGARIISGSKDRTVRLWDASTGNPILRPLEGHSSGVNSVAISPTGGYVISGSADRTICVWDVENGNTVVRLIGHTGSVTSLAFSPDGTRIASGSDDGTVRLWNTWTGEGILGPLEGHIGGITSVVFSPDGTRVISGSRDRTIRLWDTNTGNPILRPLKGHSGGINSVAISPQGCHVVSGSEDRTIRLWDASTGDVILGPLEGHTDTIWTVAFSPDGIHIASGSGDRTIRLWNTEVKGVDSSKKPEDQASGSPTAAFSPYNRQPVGKPSASTRSPPLDTMGSSSALASTSYRPLAIHRDRLRSESKFSSSIPSTPSTSNIDDSFALNALYDRASDMDPRDIFSFDSYAGWIVGPRGELVMWIPEEYWPGLWWPRNTLVIGPSRVTLDLSRFLHGRDWTFCYTELPFTTPS